MHSTFRKLVLALCPLAGALTLAACGGGEGEANALQTMVPAQPVVPQVFAGLEDSPLQGLLSIKDLPSSGSYRFDVTDQPEHGTVEVNPATGEFSYTPDADYFGTDAFNYRITKTARHPVRGRVVIDLANVNDAPVLASIDDMMNSAETLETSLTLPATDIDSEELQVTVISDDPTIATVTGDNATRSIEISPETRGTTKIRVSVSDGQFTSSQDFDFTVGDVTKSRVISANMAAGEAITLTNVTDQPIPVGFVHNEFPLFQSDQEIVDYVAQMPDQVPNEPFPRKLWRFIRDSTYHNVPLTTGQWFHDSWALIVSQGWGFCSHVTAAYVQLARAAGYEARTWGLTGHVVPEVKIGDEWQVFDPDLSTYYFKPDTKIASVADLSADPSLITSPITPLIPNYPGLQYSQMIADFYGSPSNNFIGDHVFLAVEPGRYQPLELPPGARFTYPGRWTSTLIGVDGPTQYEIPYYLQGQLLTVAGWTGSVSLPWMIWEIRGSGRVRVLGQDFDIGSTELQTLLRNPGRQIPSIEILAADSDIRIVMFMNAMRYGLNPSNNVALTGKDVWGVQVGTRLLSEEARPSATGAVVYKKPTF